MESYLMNDFSGDSFDLDAAFAISQAVDANMLFYDVTDYFSPAMSGVYSPFIGFNGCLDSVAGGVPSTNSIPFWNTAVTTPAWTGSFDGTVDPTMLSTNTSEYNPPSVSATSSAVSPAAVTEEGEREMEMSEDKDQAGARDPQEPLTSAKPKGINVHFPVNTWNGDKLRQLGAALPIAIFPRTRAELADYLLRAGTSVGRMFEYTKLSKRVNIKRDRGSYMDHVYVCKARCTLGRDGWIETEQDCDVELGGWESYLRHMKQVHIRVKREDSNMQKWALREKNKGSGRKRGQKRAKREVVVKEPPRAPVIATVFVDGLRRSTRIHRASQ